MACDTPYRIYARGQKVVGQKGRVHTEDVLVPCGQCPACKIRRTTDWIIRLQEEDKVSSSSFFVTLTYDDKHVPKTKTGLCTLDAKHFQDFMKRLRKRVMTHKKSLKYYAVGEYGSKGGRPHYHIILFNLDDVEKIQPEWEYGHIHVGSVSGPSIAYTVGYINKEKKVPQYEGDDREREFSRMSKGLGKDFLSPAMVKHYKMNITKLYVIREGGTKLAMPRYYRERIWNEKERKWQNRHIQEMTIEQEKDEEREFRRLHPDGDFEKYKTDVKIGTYLKFYKNQKPRNYD